MDARSWHEADVPLAVKSARFFAIADTKRTHCLCFVRKALANTAPLTIFANSCCPSSGRATAACRVYRLEAAAVPPQSRSSAALSGAEPATLKHVFVPPRDPAPAKGPPQ